MSANGACERRNQGGPMHRRQFMIGAAAALAGTKAFAQPAIGGKSRTIIHVPQANLPSLDPVWTSALVTRNFANMVYETLYGRDEQLNRRPLMLESHQVEEGGRRWTMRLREGLVFHDGSPVLARDCVGSIRRFLKRDAIGETRRTRLDRLEGADDHSIAGRLGE